MTYTHSEWTAEATRRYGNDPLLWKFICPSCGYVARVQDWKDVGGTEGMVAYSCVGRFQFDQVAAAKNAFKKSGGPCDYTGGGLIRLNPVTVIFENGKQENFFDFAPEEVAG